MPNNYQQGGRSARIYRRRVGRIVAGAAASLGVSVVFLTVAVSAQFSRTPDFHGLWTYAFFACWAVGIAAYIGGRIAANRFLTSPWSVVPSEPTAPQWAAFVHARAESLEGWSAALPLVALSLLLPLTLWYFVVQYLTALFDVGMIASSFDQVISLGVFLTGIAHLALALFSLRFGFKLATRGTEDLVESGPSSWIGALIITTIGGTIPGVLFMFLPALLIAVTGLYFIPIMFTAMARLIALERTDLGLYTPPVS